MTFTIFAGQSFTVHLDRVPYAHSSNDGGSSAQTYILSDTISIIAVQATKDEQYPGMIASTTDSNYILTNSSWKCTPGVTSGDLSWTSYYFNDDYWDDAYEYGVKNTNNTAIGNVRPNASWIWTYYSPWNADAVVYCRRRIGELTIVKHCTMNMMAVMMKMVATTTTVEIVVCVVTMVTMVIVMTTTSTTMTRVQH